MTHTNISSVWRALSSDFSGAVEKAGRSVVYVNARRRIPSSGVHLGSGIIITADHTLQREEEISITLPDGQSASAVLAGRDASTGLAVLKTDGLNLPPAEMGDPASLHAGALVDFRPYREISRDFDFQQAWRFFRSEGRCRGAPPRTHRTLNFHLFFALLFSPFSARRGISLWPRAASVRRVLARGVFEGIE